MPADPDEPSGPEVVHKTASLPGERERLLREAELLQVAVDRGVPGLATVVVPPSAEADDPTLVTAAVFGPSLAVAAPLPVLEVAGVAAEVAKVLAGLHEAGLVHGAVEPGHVVLDGAGGLILVGLGDGGEIGASTPGGPLREATARLDPASDVAGWGALVSHLLDWSATTEEEPLVALRRAIVGRPGRRRRSSPTPSRSVDEERRVLAALADQAQEPDAALRPSARSLAAAVAHRIPGARVPGAGASPAVTAAPPVGLLARLSGHLAEPFPAPNPDTPAEDVPFVPGAASLLGTPGRDGDGARSDVPRRRPNFGATRSHRRLAEERLLTLPPPDQHDIAPVVGAVVGQDLSRPDRQSPGRRADGPRGVRPARDPDARRRARRLGEQGDYPVDGTRRRRRVLPISRAPRLWIIGAACTAVVALGGLVAAGWPSKLARSIQPQVPSAVRDCPPVAAPAADADGDGCEEAVRWVDGVLQAGTARFALGAPGDAWVVGDWDCDGRRTPALLHDGSLAVFDSWPGPGGELQGRAVASAPGARTLSVVPGPGRCDRAALSRPGAADLVVDPRASP